MPLPVLDSFSPAEENAAKLEAATKLEVALGWEEEDAAPAMMADADDPAGRVEEEEKEDEEDDVEEDVWGSSRPRRSAAVS